MTKSRSDLLRAQDGVALIAAERKRQVSDECWTPGHDDEHRGGELAEAAAAYALPLWDEERADGWPFGLEAWKPTPDDRVRELVKAGALIAAEIDRLQRAAINREEAE